jgi:hypothetical protein
MSWSNLYWAVTDGYYLVGGLLGIISLSLFFAIIAYGIKTEDIEEFSEVAVAFIVAFTITALITFGWAFLIIIDLLFCFGVFLLYTTLGVVNLVRFIKRTAKDFILRDRRVGYDL